MSTAAQQRTLAEMDGARAISERDFDTLVAAFRADLRAGHDETVATFELANAFLRMDNSNASLEYVLNIAIVGIVRAATT